jgi:hypothetical protein
MVMDCEAENTLLYGGFAFGVAPNRALEAGRNLKGNEEFRRNQDSFLKNCAIVRNLLYRDATNSAGGIFFTAA